MSDVSVRDLRNHGGRVIERVLSGEHLVVTRDGEPVAELRPLRGRVLDAAALLARWRNLPPIDPAGLRTDIDALLDQEI